MLVDANILLYAVDAGSRHHDAASAWLEEALNGDRRVGIPWQSLGAFLRISTHPRIATSPLTAVEAWSFAQDWLDAPVSWVPPATNRTAAVLRSLVERHHVTGNLVTDAQVAALAIEHGLVVYSTDTDFARFDELRWENPLA